MGVTGMRARLLKFMKVPIVPMEPVDVRGAPGLIIRTVKAIFRMCGANGIPSGRPDVR